MFLANAVVGAVLAAINLEGASGRDLKAVASFDANNVFVGDPVELSVDFTGDADFKSFHPPELSREVDRSEWRIDDESAKTETFRNGRRIKYRVRPLKEGVLVFPALEFSYEGQDAGGAKSVSTRPVPLRARRGAQVALAARDGAGDAMPKPDGIFVELLSQSSAPDGETLFAWRKACASPSARAFAAFDFPEARCNEAACEILAGNWAKALSIYSTLEWRIGQTPAIERGMVAALALKTSNPDAELPMWRRALRPVLRFAWAGRLACLLAALAAIALVLVMAKRLVRSVACIAAVFAAIEASAADPFAEMDRHFRQMQEQMRRNMEEMTMQFGGGAGGFSFSMGGQPGEEVEIKASVKPDRRNLTAGEAFNFIVSLDMPKDCTIESQRLSCSQTTGLSQTGPSAALPDVAASATNRVVRRVAVPVRYDAPFKGIVSFSVEGSYAMRKRISRGRSFFGTSEIHSGFTAEAPKVWMEVKPLSGEGQPPDFSGAVGTDFKMKQTADMYLVETNDVVKVEGLLEFNGYVPPDALADEIERDDGRIAIRRYVVADGRADTGDFDFCWYDTAAKDYRRLKSRGMRLSYKAPAAEASRPGKVVVNASSGENGGKSLVLKFSPRADAPDVAPAGAGPFEILERSGGWVRVDDGRHAGWLRAEDAE